MISNKSFTLIELLVTISIIVLLTAVILPNYQGGDSQLALRRSVHKLAQDLRGAEEMAMNSREFAGAPGSFRGGYGIYFNVSQPYQYVLFADLDNGDDYDAGEAVETLGFEANVKINNLSPGGPLHIVFNPPDPQVSISGGSEATITLSSETDLTTTNFVFVNGVGLISANYTSDDWCNNDNDCDDGNSCSDDWCERPADPDSICHNDVVAEGTDCGDCQECQSGACTQLCEVCEACDSDSCVSAPNTNWGEGLYSCTEEDERCYNGSCVTCGGWLHDDQLGGLGCWYTDTSGWGGYSCSNICSGHGGCIADSWNDDASCTVLEYFHSCSTCQPGGSSFSPYIYGSSCYYAFTPVTWNCNYSSSGIRRVCVCRY